MVSNAQDVIAQSNLEARDYQIRIAEKVIDGFDSDLTSQLINAPTGAGKTAMGLVIAKVLQQRYGCGVAWSAMRRNLLIQAASANVESGIQIDGFMPISTFDKEPPTHDENGNKIEILIEDEAHHSCANSAIHIVNKIKPRFRIGLSGTPFRTDRVKLCYQRTIRDCGIRQLVEMGYLSKYHKYVIPEWNPQAVVARYLEDPQRWGKSAFYWRTEQDANECHRLLLAGGCNAGLVLGTQPFDERERTLEMFESDAGLDAIVNLFVLTEGWDCPNLHTAWVRDSSRGPTVQMSGRVFRKHPELPVKQIVQSQKTRYPIERTVGPDMGFVWTEGEWRSIKADDSVERVAAASMMLAAHTSSNVIPAYITKKMGKSRRRRRRRGDDGGQLAALADL